MGFLDVLRPDPTCKHGVPLQSRCFKCTPRQRTAAEKKAAGKSSKSSGAAKKVDPKRATSGTFTSGLFGGTRKTKNRGTTW